MATQADSRSTIPIPRLPKALPPEIRKLVDDAIRQHMAATDALIAFLDKVDPNDGDEEPCVTDGPHDEPDEEREPSLAHTNGIDQTHTMQLGYLSKTGSTYAESIIDGEAEHDGREPDEDAELEPGELDTADEEPRCPPMMEQA